MPAMAVRGAVVREAGSSTFVVAVLAKIAFDSCLQETCLFFVGTDDEDRVVAGDGSYDFGPILVIDSGSDRLGASGGCDEEDEIDCLTDLEAEAFEDFANSRERVFVGTV